jgi:peptidoglycan hydrolase-like protein with peptidoglycan-binding domain
MNLGMPSSVEVQRLQEMLNQIIPTPPLLRVDGIFGPKTKARVVMFQKQAGLVPDGIIGLNTSRALVGNILAVAIFGG